VLPLPAKEVLLPQGVISKTDVKSKKHSLFYIKNVAKLIIIKPKVLKEEGKELLKLIVFPSNQRVQQTTLLINSIKF
jgi:hypothetical protein